MSDRGYWIMMMTISAIGVSAEKDWRKLLFLAAAVMCLENIFFGTHQP